MQDEEVFRWNILSLRGCGPFLLIYSCTLVLEERGTKNQGLDEIPFGVFPE